MISDSNKNANLAYLGIMVWWISNYLNKLGYIAKDIYGIIIYIIYNQKTEVS